MSGPLAGDFFDSQSHCIQSSHVHGDEVA